MNRRQPTNVICDLCTLILPRKYAIQAGKRVTRSYAKGLPVFLCPSCSHSQLQETEKSATLKV